jgi:hypothetical protein
MKTQLQVRQGDVLLVGTSKLRNLKSRKRVERDHGCAVLAYGEVTGHAHMVAEPGVELIELESPIEMPDGYKVDRLLVSESGFRVLHGNLGSAQPGAAVAVASAEAVDAGVPGQDHLGIALPGGTFQVRRQREYSPEAIRNVAD